MNECVQLHINPLQGQRQLGRQGRWMPLKSCQRQTKDACFQAGHEPGYFPAVRGKKVAMSTGRPGDQPLQPQAPQIVGHLRRRVRAGLGSQQLGDMTTQIAIAEALDQVCEQAQRYPQGHHPRITKLQPRRSLTFLRHGRLHHSLDAVAREATVVAHPFDVQQPPVDVASQALEKGRLAKPLFTSKSLGLRKVPSVRSPRPSLKYCFRSKFLY